ncbi:MAG: hypothetical protein LBC04_02725 [Holosporaceae bacterium]|nr:hypothetical protein [Holosporaceae bacterium]
MKNLILLLSMMIFPNFNIYGDPIETPEFDERNEFVIKTPKGWGYRTFPGKNGLIGALWPFGTSFNSTDTAIFVFIQTNNEEFPTVPDNINLFTEKCTQANFKFSKDTHNETLSIAEKYFSGRCGKTMILFEENVGNYTIIIAVVSAEYVSREQLVDAKKIMVAYKKEIETYAKTHPSLPKEGQTSSTRKP